MTNVALFGVGLVVTVIVAAAVALLVLGAILDGREDDARRAENGATVVRPTRNDSEIEPLAPVNHAANGRSFREPVTGVQ